MLSTKKYDQFKFRDDNRDQGIDKKHLQRLIESIKSQNLLEFRPIVVNESMEVIDGQHRLTAAKELGVPIYYQVKKDFQPQDIIQMNISKSWGMMDYLNFYCKQGSESYLSLKSFIDTHGINLRIALSLCASRTEKVFNIFREGKFVFNHESASQDIGICWETIEFVKKANGASLYTESSRFWKALILLFQHPEFCVDTWFSKVSKLACRFGARASGKEYVKMVQDIYNYQNPRKIKLTGLLWEE
jgi:hypothetical protein